MIYYKGPIKSKSKFHITSGISNILFFGGKVNILGHQTVMGKITMFRHNAFDKLKIPVTQPNFKSIDNSDIPKFSFEENYEFIEEVTKETIFPIFIFLELETQFLSHEGQMIIGSKLDTDIEASICRIAFYGKLLKCFEEKEKDNLKNLKIYRPKEKKGKVERILDANNILVSGLFKKESDISGFIGKFIELTLNGKQGKIIGTFGQSGKIKVQLETSIFDSNDAAGKEKCEKDFLGSECIMRMTKRMLGAKILQT